MSFARGTLIAKRYVLREKLGSGGMGVVWRAHDRRLDRQVALKQVNPRKITNNSDSLVERLHREARAVARIDHRNVVKVFDEFMADDVFWIAMEYVKGRSLEKVIAAQGPGTALPVARVAAIGVEVLAALEAAHREEIVHRDVKPSNIILGSPGGDGEERVVLTDFGIALIEGERRLTTTGKAVGTTSYMSPEQQSGSYVTYSSDLWSLGVTLFEMAEGRLPFPQHAYVMREVRHAGPMRPLLKALLREEPSARPSISAIKARLEELARTTVPDGPRRPSPPRPRTDPSVQRWQGSPVQPRRPPEEPEPRARRTFLRDAALTLVGGSAVVGGLGGIVWFAARATRDGDHVLHLSRGDGELIDALAYAPSGELLATGSGDGAVLLWNRRTGRETATLGRHDGGVVALAFSRDGDVLASGGLDRTVRLWDVRRRRPLRTLTGHRAAVDRLAFDGDQWLATADGGGLVLLWNLRSAEGPRGFADVRDQVGALAYSPAPRAGLLAFESGGDVRLWPAGARRPRRPLPGGDGGTSALAFASDGVTLATGGDAGIRLWRLPDGTPAGALGQGEAHGRVNALAFSPGDGFLGAGCADHQATLWRVETGKAVGGDLVHDGPVSMLCFAGRELLATGSQDGAIKLWNWRDGATLVKDLSAGHPQAMAFDRDGRQIAITDADGSVTLRNV